MSKVKVYSTRSKMVKEMAWPKEFREKPKTALLAQALRVYAARQHTGLPKTKTRGEVSLTTRKWYRQKGTGKARHGAQSAPIFVGGGKAHGPKGIKRALSLPRKMRVEALKTALALKAKKGEVVVAEGIDSFKKTKEASEFIKRFVNEGKRFTLVLADNNLKVGRVFRNIEGGEIVAFNSLNAYGVYFGGILVVDNTIFEKSKESRKEK